MCTTDDNIHLSFVQLVLPVANQDAGRHIGLDARLLQQATHSASEVGVQSITRRSTPAITQLSAAAASSSVSSPAAGTLSTPHQLPAAARTSATLENAATSTTYCAAVGSPNHPYPPSSVASVIWCIIQ